MIIIGLDSIPRYFLFQICFAKCNWNSQLLQKTLFYSALSDTTELREETGDRGWLCSQLAVCRLLCTPLQVALPASSYSLHIRKSCISLLRKEIKSGECENKMICGLQQLGAVPGVLAHHSDCCCLHY